MAIEPGARAGEGGGSWMLSAPAAALEGGVQGGGGVCICHYLRCGACIDCRCEAIFEKNDG
jgi:hypothetical protein